MWVHGAGGVAARLRAVAHRPRRLVRRRARSRAGAVVVAPDLTGLGMEGTVHPYLHGTTAGRVVLDAARAAADLTTAGAGPVVALAGHSAGGFAVLWANELAAGADGDGLDVRLAVPMSPVADLAVAMAHYATGQGQAAFPVQLAATWPGVEPVDADRRPHPGGHRPRSTTSGTIASPACCRCSAATRQRWVRADGFAHGAWAAALDAAVGRAGARARRRSCSSTARPTTTSRSRWTQQLAAELTGAELLTYPGADHMVVHDAARRDVVGRILAALA